MKKTFQNRSVHNALISAMTLSVLLVAPLASASVTAHHAGHSGLSETSVKTVDINQTEYVYDMLRTASRNICGSSNLRLTGSLERSIANKQCFEGTLDAAVKRLHNSEVSELHRQRSS